MLAPEIKRRKNWSDGGVSEVVGTILILAITVVLFASIMTFVMNMPVPNNTPIADFKATLSVSGNVATLILTHNGGESIFNYKTQILVFNGTVLNAYTIKNGGIKDPTSNPTWSIGQIWSLDLNNNSAFTLGSKRINMTTKVDVDIVDTGSNSIIWSSKVGTGQSTDAPVILQRWVDSDPRTLTPDPIHASDTKGFTFYVRVANVNIVFGLSDVWIDGSAIGANNHITTMTDTGGVWSFDFSHNSNPAALDGRPLFIHAQKGTLSVSDTYILTVQTPDITNTNYHTNITYNGTMPTSDSGLPSYLKWFDADQGYVVLGADVKSGTPPQSPNLTDSRSTFTQGEYVFVRVGSFKLQNIFAKNNLTLVNRLSGTSTNPTGNSTPFYRVPSSGGVFIYEAKFSTSSLLGGYDMKISLQSTVTSGSSLISFNAVANLIVQPISGPPLVLPELRLNGTNPLNKSALQLGTYDHPFDLSDASKSIIWVDLKFLDAGAGQTLNIGKVEIRDLRDRTILSGVPPLTTGSNSTFGKVYSNLTKDYVFKIDLRLRNGYNLVPGTATYTITISNAFDGNEGVYTMSMPVWIKSATDLKNYIVATSGFGGTGNFNDISYLFQIENNKFFTTRTLEKVAMAPSFGYDTIQTYRAIYFDVDGDGDRDVIASMNTPAGYGWGVYINRMNEYGIWEPKSFYPDADGQKITALASGDVNNDGALDWANANSAGKVYLYYNSFPTTSRVLLTTPEIGAGKYVLEMRLVDMTGDGKADLVVLVGANERTSAVKGQMFIYDLSSGNAVRLPVANVNTDANVFDFDVADINKDGYNDYAASSSVNGIGWYQAVPTSLTFLADQDIAVPPTVVVPSPNGYSNTNSIGGGDEEIRESGGSATHVWRTASISGSSPKLRIDAKVNTGCTEAFYFYYSTSSSGPWTFMFYVPSSATGSYQTFNQNLRSDISGRIYIKVADSVSGDAGSTNSIFIDLIRVTTLSGMSFNTVYNSLRSDADSKTYAAIGIGDFNQAGVLDVAVGKGSEAISGTILIIDGATGAIIRTDATAAIRVTGDTFVVKDVNGDNLADIVYVLKYTETIPSPTYDSYSIVTEWVNTAAGTGGTTIEVKNLSQNYGPSASGKNQNYGEAIFGAINCITAENPFG